MKDIIYESFLLFLIVGSIIALILGVILFFQPEVIKRTDNYLNNWYSSRKAMKPFEIMRSTDSYIYNRNQVIGWVMLIASVMSLYWFFSKFQVGGMIGKLPMDQMWSFTVDIGLRSVKIFFIIFITLGIPIWILLIFKPEILKKVSEYFNRWISTRLMLMPLEKMYFQIDSIVIKYNKIFGIIIVTASLIILLTIVPIAI